MYVHGVATCTCTCIMYMCHDSLALIYIPSVCAVRSSSGVTDDSTGDRVDTLEAVGCCLPAA